MTMPSNSIPLILNNFTLTFIAEGAANIVYAIEPRNRSPRESYIEEYSETTPPPSIVDGDEEEGLFDTGFFENKLLRLRKDLPTTIPVLESQQLWERLIKPLFSSHQLVNQELVRLSPDTVSKLNNDLHVREKAQTRPSKRAGTYLAPDLYGLLVTAMLPTDTTTLIEFKPKWLTPSPSAPPNSIRCRTCALTAFRNSKRTEPIQTLPKSFCPFDLLSSDPLTLYLASKLLLPPSSESTIQQFQNFLTTNPILRNLRNLQEKFDKVGPLNADSEDESFRVAMTLRDCSVYVRLGGEGEVEARIGDLDVKSPDKGDKWREQERELIEGGWYRGQEPLSNGKERRGMTVGSLCCIIG